MRLCEQLKNRIQFSAGRIRRKGGAVFMSLLLAAGLVTAGPAALSGTAVSLPGEIDAYAAYINTNQNTFVHDTGDIQTGYAGQEIEFQVRIGYNNVDGFYGPGTDHITDVIVRMSRDPNYLNRLYGPQKNTDVSDEVNPYDPNNVDEVELYYAWREGRRNAFVQTYGDIGMTYPMDSGAYPFETPTGDAPQEFRFERLQKDQYETVTFHAQVRADAEPGYYGIPISVYYNVPPNYKADYQGQLKVEYVNVYIGTAPAPSMQIEEPGIAMKDLAFAVGEGQMTPAGRAPGIMEYGVNFRNKSGRPLYDVNVHINPELADGMTAQLTHRAKAQAIAEYPFYINESNYDRVFGEVAPEQVITAPYSMALKENTASGLYPLSYRVSYKLTPNSSYSYQEDYVNFIRVDNPSMIDDSEDLGEFKENARRKARLIVDSFHTEPEKVFAGQEFQLVLVMKNASDNIDASNILFSLESEKADNSTVFSTESGANSFVVNHLKAGETSELRIPMVASPGVDPRSYAITINEKYDSPEFKNAEEKVLVDIPVYQVARLSVSNFELMPEAIEVGRESNVMFGINNTGKVILYNVEAIFEADSIRKTSSYVGNIKPGETGNIDVMLMGMAATQDDGTIPIRIRYEDVNGNESFVDQSCTLFVSEAVPEDFGLDGGAGVGVDSGAGVNGGGEGGSPIARTAYPIAAVGVLAALAAGITVHNHRKKKKRQAELAEEDS